MATRRSTRSSSKGGGRWDYSDTEYRESEIYDGPEPTRGLLRMELVHVGDYTKQNEEQPSSVQWVFRALDGEENKHGESVAGWKGRKYTTENAKFIEQNILVGIGVMEPGGAPPTKGGNLDFEAVVKKAKPCRAMIMVERYIPEDGEPEWRATLGAAFLPDDGTTKAHAKSRAAEEDEDEDDEDEEPPPRSRRSARRQPEPEPEEDEEDEEDEDEGEEESEEGEEELDLDALAEELDSLSPVKLKAEARKYGVAPKRNEKPENLIDRILEKLEADLESGEDDEDEEPEEESEPPKARRAGRGATSARSSGSASKKRGYSDDPPF